VLREVVAGVELSVVGVSGSGITGGGLISNSEVTALFYVI
jgi:hypothetical protein